MTTKAELEKEVASLTRQLALAKGKHEAFKRKVVEVAKRGCEENGWCDEIKEYMRELKLSAYWPAEWVVQNENGWGWNDSDLYENEADARERVRQRRENGPYLDYRLVKRTLNKETVVRGA